MKNLDHMESAVSFDIEQAITEAIAQARATCKEKGNHSSDCVVAWEIVEELQLQKFQQLMTTKRKTALEMYCEAHPEAVECRIYDV